MKTDKQYWENAVASLFKPEFADSIINGSGSAELDEMEMVMISDEIALAIKDDLAELKK